MARQAASIERQLRRYRERLAALEIERDSEIDRINAIADDISVIDGELEALPDGEDRDALLASREALVEADGEHRAAMDAAIEQIAIIEAAIAAGQAEIAAMASALDGQVAEATAATAEIVLDPSAVAEMYSPPPPPEIDTDVEIARLEREFDQLDAERADLVTAFNDLRSTVLANIAKYDALEPQIYAGDDVTPEIEALFGEAESLNAQIHADNQRLDVMRRQIDEILAAMRAVNRDIEAMIALASAEAAA